MTRMHALVALSISVLLAFVVAQPALAAPAPIRASANLPVTLSFNPNPVSQNSPTTGTYTITGGTPPYTIWENNTPAGCYPQSTPFTTPNPSGTFSCTPSASGSFNIHVDVQDSAGNSGSTQVTLTVNSQSGSGGSGSGGNNTGGIDLSFLNNLLPIVMITGILFIASTVAIAVSAVALAILVPRRLKQIRKAIEGQPITGAKNASSPATPPPPQDQPPKDDL